MRLTYVVLSPTFGMSQYTAGLANHQPDHSVTVLSTRRAPADRFAPHACLQSIAAVTRTGLSPANLNPVALARFQGAIRCSRPHVVHFTAPHLWNPILLWHLRCAGIPTVHTLHDLDPHAGAGYGRLLHAWNALVLRLSAHILVHSQSARARLLARGLPPDRVTYAPLLHLFTSHENEQRLRTGAQSTEHRAQSTEPARSAPGYILFFARIEAYKGVDVLLDAMRLLTPHTSHLTSHPELVEGPAQGPYAVIAGKGDLRRLAPGPLPANVEVRNRIIEDAEAIDLFQRCSLVVLPYVDASQSALIAAAYYFRKPVMVTRVGALPEYVVDGQTGWVVEPRNPRALADCLRGALSNPARLAHMGNAGRAWYETQRTVERAALRSMYERLVSPLTPG
jgi:alpha-maltose-1-phosphate synthase